ncbi:Hypothetical predicted protein [Lecanosticta acicola]|uniref:DNA2/NAM7 helicase-like C-terminal domain-containing protein n=1 Tax=Lecanosticta acicola TaxID=111012 RepID=A0AAI8YW66_9PEZI|nr:Hypothetical predicted protein [Lecanosticta acicola]
MSGLPVTPSPSGAAAPQAPIKLVVQYRMHPDISQPASQVFYQGELKDADSTKVIVPVQRAMRQFAKATFGPAWSGTNRMAISTTGIEGAGDVQWQKTPSITNDIEAEIIVAMCKAMVAFQPEQLKDKEPLEKIEPRHIGMSSDYRGLCDHVRSALDKAGLSDVNVDFQGIEVYTANQVQDREYPIHLVAFAKHNTSDPRDLGFMTDVGQLCVQFTRAQYFHIAVGNFQAWRDDYYQNHCRTTNRLKPCYGLIDSFHLGKAIMHGKDFVRTIGGKVPEAPQMPAPPTLQANQYIPSGGSAAGGYNRGGGAGAPNRGSRGGRGGPGGRSDGNHQHRGHA